MAKKPGCILGSLLLGGVGGCTLADKDHKTEGIVTGVVAVGAVAAVASNQRNRGQAQRPEGEGERQSADYLERIRGRETPHQSDDRNRR